MVMKATKRSSLILTVWCYMSYAQDRHIYMPLGRENRWRRSLLICEGLWASSGLLVPWFQEATKYVKKMTRRLEQRLCLNCSLESVPVPTP